ncbi:MAG: outer membrane beta-barrel domain-containing protein [Alphaproteobacteria bacterium]|nr:outer membrane beta-barrel domain-containing protein [Alphaproteobacteria bacterium]
MRSLTLLTASLLAASPAFASPQALTVGVGADELATSLNTSSFGAWSLDLGLDAGDALAQDEEDSGDEDDDLLGDILGGGEGEESAGDERADLEAGQIGDNVGARQEDALVLDEDQRRKKVIKTLQRKNFLKLGRWEVSPHLAFVANDPFLNRYIIGAGIGYHITEVFEIELNLDYAPDFGQADWKPLTDQLVNENSVSPDISKMTFSSTASFLYSPIYGKVAIGKKIIVFDIYGAFGAGATVTSDDLDALQTDDTDERAVRTATQTHPTTTAGGGIRVNFTPNIAARVEGRSLVYIETVNSTTLEMKNMFILGGAFSVFFPSMRN